jgi:hypothetical protein
LLLRIQKSYAATKKLDTPAHDITHQFIADYQAQLAKNTQHIEEHEEAIAQLEKRKHEMTDQ